MTHDTSRAQVIGAACLMLAVVQTVMLAALFFGVAPHPPRAIPLFAMPPFLGVAIGTALCAFALAGQAAGRGLAVLAALMALLSFGPQKYVDPAIAEIWIAVIAAQLCVVVIGVQIWRGFRQDHD